MPTESADLTRQQAIEMTLKSYDGPHAEGTDRHTMIGKVLTGYQGWFTCPGDGSGRGWFHWGKDVFEPGNCKIDMWPDMTEYGPDERFATSFKHADGSTAYVFSSMHPATVNRHFKWMADYGIDGAFVQRFITETQQPRSLLHANTVLANCRSAANRNGRVYALMYDISGLQKGQIELVIQDWKMLVDRMRLTQDPNDKAYLRHNGKPVIAVWGIGFEGRDYTLQECAALVDFLKNDKTYGGLTVMLGIPTYWRTLRNDSVTDPFLHQIVKKADVLSPWMVGRVKNKADVEEFAYNRIWKPDLEWCKQNGKDYLPVVFPGFSWYNLKQDPSTFNAIPRNGGRFLWDQYVAAKKVGAAMVYQAMFDEVDEGTAIFKVTNDPPTGPSKFLTYEGLPSDHYLWLTGQGAKLIRGEIPTDFPERNQPQN
ncbi:MAG: glycoside hydrolase family 71/99-like protein [Planctomycetaceae bacterium]|nr:glycoside hydrolase family 71/99-like protein [Planctomycetaceae bacterium]